MFVLPRLPLIVALVASLTRHTLAYVTHQDLCNCFKGDTLLAIRAPSGTQLEVPIPESVVNGQKKYQIHLKSSSGPIDVLLVNKDPASASPVVLPVPPPEDMLQSLPASSISAPSAPVAAPIPKPAGNCTSTAVHSQRPANTTAAPATEAPSIAPSNTPANQNPAEESQQLQSSASLDSSSSLPESSAVFEPIKADPSELLDLPKELSEMFDPTKEIMSADLLEELMSSEVFSPLLRLSPPPGDHDYIYNLDETEGLCDLFDVPIANL
ncbi:hypothetical protein AMELA_G00011500 [Ameiurus melas]|uniref:E2F transcription factor CC-MB domain-containing protein n=1 Tax=Ameiurus melas TaxID=219545 RepID=A0A7J6BGR7_AMEME|nr:hypothetical protein AMELA_G00011500 [Ameiurus melas]